MIVRHLNMCALCAVLVACSSTPDLREEILSGLVQKLRIVDVRIADTRPSQEFLVHESRAGQGAAVGAVQGAVGSLAGGLQATPQSGGASLILGVVLMPVMAVGGAIYGAASAEPIVHHYALKEVEGAQALIDAAAERADLLTLIRKNLSTGITTTAGHKIRYSAPDTSELGVSEKPADVRAWVHIKTYSLLGEIEDDPSVKLSITGTTGVAVEWVYGIYWCEWSYQSRGHKLSEWGAERARKFIAEVETASEQIAAKILSALDPDATQCTEHPNFLWVEYLSEIGRDASAKKKRKQISRIEEKARRNDPDAQFEMYFKSTGDIEPKKWICLAANNGHREAQDTLGRLHWNGVYLFPKNPVLGFMWLSLAASQDLEIAKTSVTSYRSSLTSSDLAEAEQLIAEWEPDPASCETTAAAGS